MLSSAIPFPSSLPVKKSKLFVRAALPFGFALLVLLPALATVRAQHQTDETIRTETNLVTFPIRVRGHHTNQPLTKADLILKDPHHVVSELYLAAGVDRVALVFAMDRSGSIREVISAQRNAALALFARFGDRSQVAVLHFADKPQIVLPFGRNLNEIGEAFNFSAATNQRTAIFDAAAAALRTLAELPRVRFERRIVILVSDGLDTASVIKPSAVIAQALEMQVSFYVIHLPLFAPRDGRLVVRPPADGFKNLAEKTGGKYFLAANAKSALAARRDVNLEAIFQAIEEDLRSQYLLGFYFAPNAKDKRKHRIEVSLPPGCEYQLSGTKYARTHEFFDVLTAKR